MVNGETESAICVMALAKSRVSAAFSRTLLVYVVTTATNVMEQVNVKAVAELAKHELRIYCIAGGRCYWLRNP